MRKIMDFTLTKNHSTTKEVTKFTKNEEKNNGFHVNQKPLDNKTATKFAKNEGKKIMDFTFTKKSTA